MKASLPTHRSKAKRRKCPKPKCGRVWYLLAGEREAEEEPDVCPFCRLGHPLTHWVDGKLVQNPE